MTEQIDVLMPAFPQPMLTQEKQGPMHRVWYQFFRVLYDRTGGANDRFTDVSPPVRS
jgi:hypothetical protein